MVTKITQQDDKVTLTIELDKETAKRLRFDEKAPTAELVGDGLYLSSNDGEERRAEIAQVLGELDEQWGSVFKKLAE